MLLVSNPSLSAACSQVSVVSVPAGWKNVNSCQEGHMRIILRKNYLMQCLCESTVQESSKRWYQGTRKILRKNEPVGADLWASAPPVEYLRVKRWCSSPLITCWKWLPDTGDPDINHNVCVWWWKLRSKKLQNGQTLRKTLDIFIKGGELHEHLCFLTECGLLVWCVGRLDYNQWGYTTGNNICYGDFTSTTRWRSHYILSTSALPLWHTWGDQNNRTIFCKAKKVVFF